MRNYKVEAIRHLAYFKWEKRGKPQNDSWTDWLEAEAEWTEHIKLGAFVFWVHRGRPAWGDWDDWFRAEYQFYLYHVLGVSSDKMFRNPKLSSPEQMFLLCDNCRDYRKFVALNVDAKSGAGFRTHIQGIVSGSHKTLLTHSKHGLDYGRLYFIDRDRKRVSDVLTGNYGYNHPGGCQALGNFVFIAEEPVYGDRSIISLYFFNADDRSETLGAECCCHRLIVRPNAKAEGVGATTFTYRSWEKLLVGVLCGNEVDFYIADHAALLELLRHKGNCSSSVPRYRNDRGEQFAIPFTFLGSIGRVEGDASGLCLVTDVKDETYMFEYIEIRKRRSYLRLYKLEKDRDSFEIDKLNHIGEKQIYTDNSEGIGVVSFAWGAGINIISSNHLQLWATEKKLDQDLFRMNCFDFKHP